MFGNTRSDATVTVLNQGGASKALGGGSQLRTLMENNFDPQALRTNNVLLYDEWKLFDNVIIQIARERLIMANLLMSRGLTYPIPNALGVIQLQWQRSGDMNPAEVSMTGLSEADKDEIDFDFQSMPIPMIHKEFQMDARTLAITRRGGMPLDTTQAEIATRKIAEMVEQIIFNGMTIGASIGAIYGLMTQPYRNTGSVTASWLTATGTQVIADAIAMQNALMAKNMFGPYVLVVPLNVYNALAEDYKTYADVTILERLLKIPGIDGIIPTSRMTGTNVLMVQLTSDVIQLIDGIQPMMVEWENRGGFELNFMIFCIMLPRVRADYLNQCGIAHYS